MRTLDFMYEGRKYLPHGVSDHYCVLVHASDLIQLILIEQHRMNLSFLIMYIEAERGRILANLRLPVQLRSNLLITHIVMTRSLLVQFAPVHPIKHAVAVEHETAGVDTAQSVTRSTTF